MTRPEPVELPTTGDRKYTLRVGGSTRDRDLLLFEVREWGQGTDEVAIPREDAETLRGFLDAYLGDPEP